MYQSTTVVVCLAYTTYAKMPAMKPRRVSLILISYFVIYLALCIIFKGKGYTNEYYVLVSVCTFLYGIFIAFSIYNHQTRLSRVKELLRTDDSCLVSLHRQGGVFGNEVQSKITDHIDSYLITQIDYKITDDYHESTHAFQELYEYILGLSPTNDKQLAVYQSMITTLNSSGNNRKLVGTLVRQKMTNLEWSSVIGLHTFIAYILFTFVTGSIVLSILTSLIVVAGFIMIIVLYQLNNLTWQENEWIWRPLHNLFLDLGLLPYYPEIVLDSRRAIVPKGTKIRVCRYNKPYPDMTDNEIHTLEWSN
jgi:hypothetical protein